MKGLSAREAVDSGGKEDIYLPFSKGPQNICDTATNHFTSFPSQAGLQLLT